MGVIAPEQLGHRVGVGLVSLIPSIIVTSYVTRRPVAAACSRAAADDLGDRPAPVQRDEDVAQRIARRVEARPPG